MTGGRDAGGARAPVSAIVLTQDEEDGIEACLESLAGWVGELFVVDSGSTDRTLERARRYTDRIVTHPFESYSAQRNWAQESLPLAFDWVLHIDAGERVSPELAASIRAALAGSPESVAGFIAPCRYVFMGRWLRWGGRYPVYHLRLYRRRLGRCEDRLYDQHFVVEGSVARLVGDLIDITSASLQRWSERHVRWAALEAREAGRTSAREGARLMASLGPDPRARRRWWREVVFARAPRFARALGYFGLRYVLQLGFLDGRPGLIYHVLQAFWFRFLVDAMLYERRLGEERS